LHLGALLVRPIDGVGERGDVRDEQHVREKNGKTLATPAVMRVTVA